MSEHNHHHHHKHGENEQCDNKEHKHEVTFF